MSDASDRQVRRWLVASAVTVALLVAVGGITRLTESGLSITEWKPVSGVLPPLSSRAWDEAYRHYLAIPEAQTVHRGITLGQFRALFWWEWVHRLLARLVGLVLTLPYFVLLTRGRIRRGLRGRLLLLPILVAAQGALGWYMVSSGLAGRESVSPYRLTAHLGMALAIYVICVWSAMELGAPDAGPGNSSLLLRRSSHVAVCLVIVTMLSGGFVAGLDAGRVYNTFPLMGGHIVPPGYLLAGAGWRNPFENPAAAQFHHRILALATATCLLMLAAAGRRPTLTAALRRSTGATGLAVMLQVGLGIATLLLRVPVALGVLHQVTALAVLTLVVVTAHRAREVN